MLGDGEEAFAGSRVRWTVLNLQPPGLHLWKQQWLNLHGAPPLFALERSFFFGGLGLDRSSGGEAQIPFREYLFGQDTFGIPPNPMS